MYSHGITFGGHPVMCAIALKNIEIMKRERIIEHVRAHRGRLPRDARASCSTCRSSATSAATGFFYAIELVKDKDTRETFSDEECETLLRGFLSHALFDAGLICRADDRGDPVIQISPPLVAGQAEFDEITRILGEVLTGRRRRSCARSGRRSDARRPRAQRKPAKDLAPLGALPPPERRCAATSASVAHEPPRRTRSSSPKFTSAHPDAGTGRSPG